MEDLGPRSAMVGLLGPKVPEDIYIRAKCLQCELKQLPCDMRQPCCTRCERMNDQPCLVQRQTALSDILQSDEPPRLGVLLALQDEDGKLLETKKEKQKQLLEEQVIKDIWALPRIDSVRGGSFIIRLSRDWKHFDIGPAGGFVVRWSPVRRLAAPNATDDRRDSGVKFLGQALDNEDGEQTISEDVEETLCEDVAKEGS